MPKRTQTIPWTTCISSRQQASRHIKSDYVHLEADLSVFIILNIFKQKSKSPLTTLLKASAEASSDIQVFKKTI